MNSRLGVLDQSPIAAGGTTGQALRNSLELAQAADRWGYQRFWLAEHHGTPALACASPEAMIGPVAAATKQIRVGSGGIMLPHYSPLKVAETFSMLSGLYPDRIDLGIGRAAGTSPPIAFALQRDRRQRSPDDFHEQLTELLGYFDDSQEKDSPLSRITASLPSFTSPRPHLLGSSLQSAIWAAELGLPYVFADFIKAEGGAQAVDYYREHFRPSESLASPYVLVASWVICAETETEALDLSASMRMLMTLLHQGKFIAVPPVSRAKDFLLREGVRPDHVPPGRRMIVGSPSQVRSDLVKLGREYGGVDEFLLVNILFDHQARLRSYDLTAREFGLAENVESLASVAGHAPVFLARCQQ